ncbi:hypothetical protein AB0M39_26465 [Streptomyces sp. NPDC051907]|uniref:hypothetical protein n=1 Tax=Streptomyces sp. NPDC051907 TaxID=3155284 RepID=UPI00343B23D0
MLTSPLGVPMNRDALIVSLMQSLFARRKAPARRGALAAVRPLPDQASNASEPSGVRAAPQLSPSFSPDSGGRLDGIANLSLRSHTAAPTPCAVLIPSVSRRRA